MQLALELVDQVGLEDLGALARIEEVGPGDVPAADDELSGLDHGEDLLDGLVHILQMARLLVEPEANVGSGALSEGAVEVGRLDAVLGLPGDLVLVGEEASDQGGAIVAANADEQHSKLGDLLLSGNLVLSRNVLE